MMQKILLPHPSGKSREFVGEKILEQRLNPCGSVEAYINERNLLVFVRYPDYQPTDAIEIGIEHAVIPLSKLYRAAGRGRFMKKLLGGPDVLIYEKLHEHYPIFMIGELLAKLNLRRAYS